MNELFWLADYDAEKIKQLSLTPILDYFTLLDKRIEKAKNTIEQSRKNKSANHEKKDRRH